LGKGFVKTLSYLPLRKGDEIKDASSARGGLAITREIKMNKKDIHLTCLRIID
jgi:hypothetical protein